jgi:hypothetical protein
VTGQRSAQMPFTVATYVLAVWPASRALHRVG